MTTIRSQERRNVNATADWHSTSDRLLDIQRIVKRTLFELATTHPTDLPDTHVRIIQAHAENLFKGKDRFVADVVAKCATTPDDAIINEVGYVFGEQVELAAPPPPPDYDCGDYASFEMRLTSYLDAGKGEAIIAEAHKFGFITEDAGRAMEFLDDYVKKNPSVVLFEGVNNG